MNEKREKPDRESAIINMNNSHSILPQQFSFNPPSTLNFQSQIHPLFSDFHFNFRMVFGKRKIQELEYESEREIEMEHNIEEEDDTHEIEEISDQRTTSSSPVTPSMRQKQVDTKPLYKEVTLIGAAEGKNPGGAKKWECNHCKKRYTGSYTRIHVHFFGAQPGKKAKIQRCQVMISNRVEFLALRKRVEESEKLGISSSLKCSTITKKQIMSKKPIQESFGIMEREAVDLHIMRGLCANGIPFNVLRNPEFVSMIKAINKPPKDYKAPSYERARTTLLDECKSDIEKDLCVVKETWYTQGVSIVSDGWSNVKQNPLINVIAQNSRGAMFLYADDFSGVEKTGTVIAEYLLKAIEEIGPSNVLQIITVNASNCKATGKEIEKVHPHIFWSPCVVHSLNLILKSFAKELPWLETVYKRGKVIVKFFLNHGQTLAMFRANSKLELLKVAKTRFASHYIMLKRLLDCREALATSVVLNVWKDWLKCCDGHTRKLGEEVANLIGNDDFWDEISNALIILKPIYYLIKFADGEGTKMGEIYERMDNMIGEIKDIMKGNRYKNHYPRMESIIMERWEKMNIPLHCLAFALSPRFYDSYFLQSLAPGGVARRAPNFDKEVMEGVMAAFSRIAGDSAEDELLRKEFATFTLKKGLYAMPAAQADAVTMDAIDWWCSYGSETPTLAEVAKKVLSQPISSSSAERNWSTYSYIHSVKRNRLNASRADKLVFIHSNIRLLSRFTTEYKQGPYRKWDVDPDNSILEDSTVKLEDMRWECLNQDFEEGPSKEKENEQNLSMTSTRNVALQYKRKKIGDKNV